MRSYSLLGLTASCHVVDCYSFNCNCITSVNSIAHHVCIGILPEMLFQDHMLKLLSSWKEIRNVFYLKYFKAPRVKNLSKFDSNSGIIIIQYRESR